MARRTLLWALLLATGCRLEPAGRCETRADCAAGLDCLAGVCAACRGDADCSAWDACGATGLCAPLAGRCDGSADCASWDLCDASHTCILRPDHCPNVTCGPIERCDPEHHCTLQPGRCNGGSDCVAWMAGCDVPSNSCLFGAAPGDDVLALGTLTEGRTDRGAAARASAPTKVEVGLDAGSASDGRAFVDPVTGELVYRHVGDPGGDTLRRFNRDAVVRDPVAALWLYPATPSADDELAIDAGVCPMTWGPWIMQAVAVEGVGAAPRPLQYGCPVNGGLFDFYDSSGTRQLQGVQAVFGWSANGSRFIRAANQLQIVSAVGATVPVTNLPVGAHHAYRTTPTGFRVALYDYASGLDELWELDEVSAVAVQVGTYATVPNGYAAPSWEALDSDGTLYGRSSLATYDVVLKRPLAPAVATEVYDEGAMVAGSNDFAAATFSPFLRLDPASFLLTVP